MENEYVELIRKRRMPIIGDGGGVWSFVHVDDAAAAPLAAVERGAPGIYNVVDDDPVRASDWLPSLAESLGAKPDRSYRDGFRAPEGESASQARLRAA